MPWEKGDLQSATTTKVSCTYVMISIMAELERAIDDWIPESGVKLARLETEFDTFVWEASSPLQNGQNSTSLAIISDSLPPKLLQHVWYQTSSSDKELERQLIQTSKHLHE